MTALMMTIPLEVLLPMLWDTSMVATTITLLVACIWYLRRTRAAQLAMERSQVHELESRMAVLDSLEQTEHALMQLGSGSFPRLARVQILKGGTQRALDVLQGKRGKR